MENFCIIKKFLPFYYWNALNTLYIYIKEKKTNTNTELVQMIGGFAFLVPNNKSFKILDFNFFYSILLFGIF